MIFLPDLIRQNFIENVSFKNPLKTLFLIWVNFDPCDKRLWPVVKVGHYVKKSTESDNPTVKIL